MMNRKGRRDSGFTLIELLVVVLIIGILAALGIPSYLKTVETQKADDAVALVNMIGTTNKMFALDHGGAYIGNTASQSFPTSSNTGCPGACPTAGPYVACDLVKCKYLSDQNFGSKPYQFWACDPALGACGASGGTNATAGAKRTAGTYIAWGYSMNAQGVISPNATGAPVPTY